MTPPISTRLAGRRCARDARRRIGARRARGKRRDCRIGSERQIEHPRRLQRAFDHFAESDRHAAASGIGDALMRRVAAAQDHRPAAPQPRRRVAIDDDAGQFGQAGLDATATPRPPSACVSISSSVKASSSRNGPTRVRRSAMTWPKQPSSAAEIAGDGADIGALAAFGLEARVVGATRRSGRSAWIVDRARLQIDRLALAGEVIGALAVDLDRRELRRHLHDRRR